jgi:hypothetical protein
MFAIFTVHNFDKKNSNKKSCERTCYGVHVPMYLQITYVHKILWLPPAFVKAGLAAK